MARASAHAIDLLFCRIRDESPAMAPPTGACNGAARARGKLSVCALRATDSRALRVPEVAPHTPEARVAKPDECWQTRPLYGGRGGGGGKNNRGLVRRDSKGSPAGSLRGIWCK